MPNKNLCSGKRGGAVRDGVPEPGVFSVLRSSRTHALREILRRDPISARAALPGTRGRAVPGVRG
jgi:hypothetical protein